MNNPNPKAWMWSDAIDMLTRAERLHRQMFQPAVGGRAHTPVWEPPVDVLETQDALQVLAALPGVDPDHIQVTIHNGLLVIAGHRTLPPGLRTAMVHRLELPQGRFERRLALPPGRFEVQPPSVVNGCLIVTLRKLA